MAARLRLLTLPGSDSQAVSFALAWATPNPDESAPCHQARLDTGDGQTLDLGVICAPTCFTWREQRQAGLAEHRYSRPGPAVARLHWGEVSVEAAVEAAPAAAPPIAAPDLPLFHIQVPAERPFEREVKVKVTGLGASTQVRLDGGVGQVHTLHGADGAEQAGEWTCTYPKPGQYCVTLDLLDAEGFWLATLGETPIEVAEPLPPVAALPAAAPAEAGVTAPPATRAVDIAAAAAGQPWLPYRYGRPAWGGARVYSSPGGGQVTRVVGSGVYLGIRSETTVGGALWYLTAGGDWVAASAVSLMTPSDLRGVEVGESQPSEEPPASRRGVVTADVLNVRARPGVSSDNPPIDQLTYGAEVDIYEETAYAGATWYRIGTDRWVYGAYIRITSGGSGGTTTRRGVVTADVLNVRAQPGVRSNNPPIDQLYYGSEVTIYEEQAVDGATWYRIGVNRWVHSGYIRIVQTSAAASTLVAAAAAVASDRLSLPVGWVTTSALNVRARPGVSADNPPIDQVAHNGVVSVLESRAASGSTWYRIGDNRWVDGTHVGVARVRARPASIGSSERWVGINLREQTAVAYEGDRPIYAALVASGMAGTPTVQGIFRTWRRLVTGVMAGSGYYIEDVTWTCYFYSGYALHTAYWHDAFGAPRSHGCINLSPYDAWWIYQWSAAGGANSPAVYVYSA